MKHLRRLAWILWLPILAGFIAACVAPTQPGPGMDTSAAAPATEEPITLQFYYPVHVAGPLAQAIESYVADFNAQHTDVQVEAIFTGNYFENMARAQAAIEAGQPPDVAILLSTDLYTLLDMDAIIPLDEYIAGDNGLDMDDFFEGFMYNSIANGQVWGIPWQRSTPILYYNKDIFAEVDLDPESPPATWDELIEYAKILQVGEADNVTRWGVEIPTTDWLFGNFAIQAGHHIGSTEDDPCAVYLDTPAAIEAAEFLRSLQIEHGVMPDGVVSWQTAPADFAAGAAAMIYHSTGSLSSVLESASFEVGTAFLPAGPEGYGVNVGGGNFYIMKDIPRERQDAAWTFIAWMARPEQLGQWNIDSGYIAPRLSSWEVEPLLSYVEETPQAATARDQLPHGLKEFPATLQGPQVKQTTVQALEAIYTGQMTPEESLRSVQARINEILQQAGCVIE